MDARLVEQCPSQLASQGETEGAAASGQRRKPIGAFAGAPNDIEGAAVLVGLRGSRRPTRMPSSVHQAESCAIPAGARAAVNGSPSSRRVEAPVASYLPAMSPLWVSAISPVWTLTAALLLYMLFKMRRTRRPKQLSLARKSGWGGARKGAGRKRKDGQAGVGVPHLRRPELASRNPVHVTLKVRREVWSLRRSSSVSALKGALRAAKGQEGQPGQAPLRVVHFAVLSNHLHLIVEARDRVALARGLQSLEIRMARALNASMDRKGRVFADRYHAHILKTPTEVGRARRYVLENAAVHARRAGLQPSAGDGLTSLSMPECASPPRTWLLAAGWRRERTAS